MKRKPAAFLSYVRSDDNSGHLSDFSAHLSAEVRLQMGEEFPIFQDRNEMEWARNWKERVEDSLDADTFLISILTPSFFRSPICHDELHQFLLRERKLRREDLILPVYYVDCPLLNDKTIWATAKLAQVLANHQPVDWRVLRFEAFGSPAASKTLAQLAGRIHQALRGGSAVEEALTKSAKGKGRVRAWLLGVEPPARVESLSGGTIRRGAASGEGQLLQTTPRTLVVDPMHRGDYATITEALHAAAAGDRIIVRPGLYVEALTIDRPLEIIGDGDLGEVVVQATGKNALLFATTMGRVINLTLRQMGGGDWYCVDIAQGRLELEDCDITSQSLSCVAIHGHADPRLRHNRIHDGKQGGVFIYDNAQGILEENEIFANGRAGVAITEGGNPILRHNRIYQGREGGVFIYGSGQGILEENEIFGNAHAGVAIAEGGDPTLRRNGIHDGRQSGTLVYEKGRGTLEENDIYNNAFAGVAIATGGNPTLCRNRIRKNGYEAIWIYDRGTGTIEENDLRGNTGGAWDISADSDSNLTRARNRE
jgi:F-box protein 11